MLILNYGCVYYFLAFLHTLSTAALDVGGDYIGIEKYIDSKLTVPVLSGMITGGLYRSNGTPRAVAMASVVGGVFSVGYSYMGTVWNVVTGRGGRF